MDDADNGGACACVQAGGIWEISISSSHFCYKPTTSLNYFFLSHSKKSE